MYFTLHAILYGKVNAYNYEPPVEVGDEIVYTYHSTSPSYQNFTHLKMNVTEIEDTTSNTKINGYVLGSEDNRKTYEILYFDTPAVLMNYSLSPITPIGSMNIFVVPGTKIGDYAEEITAILFSGTATSIENGYGIKIVNSTVLFNGNRTVVYDEEGILIKYRYESTYLYEFDIFSINGKRYSIPGYSTLLIIGFMLLSVLGLYFTVLKKKSHRF